MSRAVLITGCSSGIGRAAAFALQQRGYQVIASCRKKQDQEQLVADGLKHVILLDLQSSQSIQAAVKETLAITGGSLYALFNNGAYGQPGAVEDLTREALRRQFETNLFGTHELTRLLIPTLLNMPEARIVQNSSVLGLVPMYGRGAYVASKYALEGLTDTLRLELRDTAIQLSLIEPGPITSHFRQNALAALQAEVDVDNSRHQAMYQKALARLSSKSLTMKYTLPESAVVEKLIHALESRRAKARYYVTTPTYVMGFLKRVLSTRALDAFIAKVGKP